MDTPSFTNNQAHAENLRVLSAAVEMGAEAISMVLGDKELNVDGAGELSNEDICQALTARIALKLGI